MIKISIIIQNSIQAKHNDTYSIEIGSKNEFVALSSNCFLIAFIINIFKLLYWYYILCDTCSFCPFRVKKIVLNLDGKKIEDDCIFIVRNFETIWFFYTYFVGLHLDHAFFCYAFICIVLNVQGVWIHLDNYSYQQQKQKLQIKKKNALFILAWVVQWY